MRAARVPGWASIAVVLVGAAACGGSETETESETGTGDPGAGAASTTAVTEPAAEEGLVAVDRSEDDLPSSGSDLFARSDTGLLFLDDTLLSVGEVDGEVLTRDLGEAVLGDDGEIASFASPLALCGTDVVTAAIEREGAGGVIVGVDAASGDQLWEATVSEDGSSPLACAGDVVVALGDGEVVGLDAGDGTERWSAPLDADDPPLAGGDLAVIGTYDGVVGLDLATGEERWRVGESSDRALSVQRQGAVVELIDTFQVIAPDGEVLAELPEEVLDLLEGEGSVRAEDLALAGPDDAPVLVVPEGAGVVSMDGELTELAVEDAAGTAVVGGAAGERVWLLRTAVDSEAFEVAFTTELVEPDGTVVWSVAVPPLSETGGRVPNVLGFATVTTDLALLDDETVVVRR